MDTVVFRETTVHFYSCMRYKLMHTGRREGVQIDSSRGGDLAKPPPDGPCQLDASPLP